MSFNLRTVSVALILVFAGIHVFSQEDEYENLLQRIDTIENPVYKPHLSLSYGSISFLGDIHNTGGISLYGNTAYKVIVTTFIDKSQYFAANFSFMSGIIFGETRSLSGISQNLNFSTDLYSVGASARYEFGHLLPEELLFRPYVTLGFEQINFDPKGDLFDSEGNFYQYWSDGTIRILPEDSPGAALPVFRDYNYETDLRKWEKDTYNLGDYKLRSFGIPIEVGFTMKVMKNLYVSLGTEYHYTFTDFMDNVASEGTKVTGNAFNDSYFFTNVGLHFDLFSEPKTRKVDLLYAELEFDPLLFDDEDGDFIIDLVDRCPGTPYGIATDTVGCPFDSDNDQVPDYMDQEPDSKAGAWVNDEGITIDEDELTAMLSRDRAMDRKDVYTYFDLYDNIHGDRVPTAIPEKFKSVDINGDNYLSFDELLLVIDSYFDFKANLSIDELRELNEFFFSQ